MQLAKVHDPDPALPLLEGSCGIAAFSMYPKMQCILYLPGTNALQHAMLLNVSPKHSHWLQRTYAAECRSSSSLYSDNSVSVAASALWRLPLVYVVLNVIRILAITGKQLDCRLLLAHCC